MYLDANETARSHIFCQNRMRVRPAGLSARVRICERVSDWTNCEGWQRLGAGWKYTRLDRPWKRTSEHRQPAFRLIFSRLILNHIPVFGENSVLNAHYVGRNPIDRQTDIRKPSMDKDETPICTDNPRLIPECQRKVFNETKQSLTSGRN